MDMYSLLMVGGWEGSCIRVSAEGGNHLFDASGFVERNYERITPRYDFAGMSADDLLKWQVDFRDDLGHLLGAAQLRALYGDLPLSPRQEGEWAFHDFRCQKWYITSEPGVEIPFYFFKPDAQASNCPLLLVLHGHNSIGKEVILSSDSQEHALVIAALEKGYAVIAPDVRGFGGMKREEEQLVGLPNSCEELQRRSLMLGRTLVGDRVYDVMRLLDFASQRQEIDERQMIVNGHSGGGTVTLFSSAIDTRISAAIPASYFCTFHASVLSIRHCVCNVIPGILELGEMDDIAMLCFPRPVLFIHGKEDPIFPVKATLKAFSKVSGVYKQMGLSARCQLHVGDYGHMIDHEPMWPFLERVKSVLT